jgi:hypothetical protein
MTNQPGTAFETTSVHIWGPGYNYRSESQPDGSTIWRTTERTGSYLLSVPAVCTAGWEWRGTDLVAGRVADHLACALDAAHREVWIDRNLGIVTRTQSDDPTFNDIAVEEVVDLQLGPQPASLFVLTAGASVVVQ